MAEPRTLREQVTACALSAVLTIGAMVGQSSPVAAQAKPISDQEVSAIAADAYLYLYPLVIMDLTRRQMTNVPAGKEPPFGPANTFNNMTEYPPATLRVVVRPNFDTLYSSAWLDLTKEPVILSVPDTHGRYYLLPMMDMWTDVFASPGWRTTGTEAQHFLVAPAGWRPDLIDRFIDESGGSGCLNRISAPLSGLPPGLGAALVSLS
jgi:hypothetical protein